ncbi:hypothetical protein HanRHA438_Chr16g0786251 [Helianthus annuus]|nr:hypothetical protein HanRHA438_Chr16g0786251 [Helianthus annuus]
MNEHEQRSRSFDCVRERSIFVLSYILFVLFILLNFYLFYLPNN